MYDFGFNEDVSLSEQAAVAFAEQNMDDLSAFDFDDEGILIAA